MADDVYFKLEIMKDCNAVHPAFLAAPSLWMGKGGVGILLPKQFVIRETVEDAYLY